MSIMVLVILILFAYLSIGIVMEFALNDTIDIDGIVVAFWPIVIVGFIIFKWIGLCIRLGKAFKRIGDEE